MALYDRPPISPKTSIQIKRRPRPIEISKLDNFYSDSAHMWILHVKLYLERLKKSRAVWNRLLGHLETFTKHVLQFEENKFSSGNPVIKSFTGFFFFSNKRPWIAADFFKRNMESTFALFSSSVVNLKLSSLSLWSSSFSVQKILQLNGKTNEDSSSLKTFVAHIYCSFTDFF